MHAREGWVSYGLRKTKRRAMQVQINLTTHEAVTKEGEWIEILLDRRPWRKSGDDRAPAVRMIGATDGGLVGSG